MRKTIYSLLASTILLVEVPVFPQDLSLEEIIVTAQKREQSQQDVPMAISTVSENRMAKTGVFRPADLVNIVPNLNVATPHASGAPNFSMRGISVSNEYGYNQASPIGVYVNEIYLAPRFTHGANLFDMERVEVLRGPQGTLYGRNTTGGAINFITRDPSLEGGNNGYITAGYGNRNRVNVEGAADGTINDNWGIRLAGKFTREDDYMENVNPNGSDGQGGRSLAGRLSIRYKDDSKDLVLRGYVADEEAGGTGVIALAAGDANALTGVDNRAGLTDRQFNSNRTEDVKINAKGLILQAKINVSDDVEITSITAWDKGYIDQPVFDWSASPVAFGWGELADREQANPAGSACFLYI